MHQFQIILNRQYFILSSPHLKFPRCRRIVAGISMNTFLNFFFYSRHRGNFPAMAYCTVNNSFIIIKSSTRGPVSSSPGCSDTRTLQPSSFGLGQIVTMCRCGYIPSPVEGDRRSVLQVLLIPYSHFKVFIYHSKVMICLPTGLLKAKHFYELA